MVAIALVPARSMSKRVPHKNVRVLGEHPLIAYTVSAALDSEVFDHVVLSTDSEDYAAIGRHYGADVPFLRPGALAHDASPDIDWVDHALETLDSLGRRCDVFSILRPTSPFRSSETIRRAMATFRAEGDDIDSIRAVEPCSQHPGKMWTFEAGRLVPLLSGRLGDVPWHSSPTQYLPPVWVQNASLEIAWSRCVREERSISGTRIAAFQTTGDEGLDVNTEKDWLWAESLLSSGQATLPPVRSAPWARVEERKKEQQRG